MIRDGKSIAIFIHPTEEDGIYVDEFGLNDNIIIESDGANCLWMDVYGRMWLGRSAPRRVPRPTGGYEWVQGYWCVPEQHQPGGY